MEVVYDFVVVASIKLNEGFHHSRDEVGSDLFGVVGVGHNWRSHRNNTGSFHKVHPLAAARSSPDYIILHHRTFDGIAPQSIDGIVADDSSIHGTFQVADHPYMLETMVPTSESRPYMAIVPWINNGYDEDEGVNTGFTVQFSCFPRELGAHHKSRTEVISHQTPTGDIKVLSPSVAMQINDAAGS